MLRFGLSSRIVRVGTQRCEALVCRAGALVSAQRQMSSSGFDDKSNPLSSVKPMGSVGKKVFREYEAPFGHFPSEYNDYEASEDVSDGDARFKVFDEVFDTDGVEAFKEEEGWTDNEGLGPTPNARDTDAEDSATDADLDDHYAENLKSPQQVHYESLLEQQANARIISKYKVFDPTLQDEEQQMARWSRRGWVGSADLQRKDPIDEAGRDVLGEGYVMDEEEVKAEIDALEAQVQRQYKQKPKVWEVKRDQFGRSYGTGKRKTSVARVWIKAGSGHMFVNTKPSVEYFPHMGHRADLVRPFQVCGALGQFDVWATVKGGGVSSQAGALKHGISKALLAYDPTYRPPLRQLRMLTRDPRMVERKKWGKKKARKSFTYVRR